MHKRILTREQADVLREVRHGLAAKVNQWAEIEKKVRDMCDCDPHDDECPSCHLYGLSCEVIPVLNEFYDSVEKYLLQRPTP